MATQFVGVFSIGRTLDRGLRLFKLAWKKVIPLMLLPFVLGLGAYVGFAREALSTGFSQMQYAPLYVAGFILNVVGSIWAWVISSRYIYKLSVGENLTTSEMLRLADFRDLLLIITSFLWVAAAMIGFVLLIVPYIYLINLMNIGFLICILERKYFVNGIVRTCELVKQRWWKTAGVNILAGIVGTIPVMAGMMILTFLSVLLLTIFSSNAFSNEQNLPVLMIMYYIAYFALFSLSIPLISSIQIVHYHSLRCEKESFDIESRIDEIGSEKDGALSES
ncbi:MAG: hypothetical protein ACLFQB_14850 [Chitinispirillaceae bacterium]